MLLPYPSFLGAIGLSLTLLSVLGAVRLTVVPFPVDPEVTDVLLLGVTVTVEPPVVLRLFEDEVVVWRLLPVVLLLPVVVCRLLVELTLPDCCLLEDEVVV